MPLLCAVLFLLFLALNAHAQLDEGLSSYGAPFLSGAGMPYHVAWTYVGDFDDADVMGSTPVSMVFADGTPLVYILKRFNLIVCLDTLVLCQQ